MAARLRDPCPPSENYANHDEIGRALADAAIPRTELFLADKLSFPQSYSAAGVRQAVGESLRKLRYTRMRAARMWAL